MTKNKSNQKIFASTKEKNNFEQNQNKRNKMNDKAKYIKDDPIIRTASLLSLGSSIVVNIIVSVVITDGINVVGLRVVGSNVGIFDGWLVVAEGENVGLLVGDTVNGDTVGVKDGDEVLLVGSSLVGTAVGIFVGEPDGASWVGGIDGIFVGGIVVLLVEDLLDGAGVLLVGSVVVGETDGILVGMPWVGGVDGIFVGVLVVVVEDLLVGVSVVDWVVQLPISGELHSDKVHIESICAVIFILNSQIISDKEVSEIILFCWLGSVVKSYNCSCDAPYKYRLDWAERVEVALQIYW